MIKVKRAKNIKTTASMPLDQRKDLTKVKKGAVKLDPDYYKRLTKRHAYNFDN